MTVNVLLIEDNIEEKKFLELKFKRNSFNKFLIHAGTIKKSLEILETSKDVDCILLDLNLPDGFGFETLYNIYTQYTHIPIVVYTGEESPELLVRCLNLGAQDYVIKNSVSIDSLNRVIDSSILRKKKELEIIKQSENKAMFLTTMSHEIRTPLNAINGVTEYLSDHSSTFSNQDKEYIEVIKRSSTHLLSLVNDLMDYSKLEAGKFIILKENFNLKFLLNNVEKIVSPLAKEKNLSLNFRIDHGINYRRKGDFYRINQVLINLITNAIRYTSKGKVDISIKPYSTSHKLIFEVKDTGPGIPAENLQGLFEAFNQDTRAIKKRIGTGLGLTISKKLVTEMNGEMKVESKVGEGSCFSFILDLPTTKSSPHQSKPLDTDEIPKDKKILIVDDNSDNLLVFELFLKGIGLDLHFCHSGAEAIELFETMNFDLAFFDMQMPQMTGYELATHIHKIGDERNQKRLNIIAQSASSLDEDRKKAFDSGCIDFLQKPFAKVDLLKILSTYLTVDNE